MTVPCPSSDCTSIPRATVYQKLREVLETHVLDAPSVAREFKVRQNRFARAHSRIISIRTIENYLASHDPAGNQLRLNPPRASHKLCHHQRKIYPGEISRPRRRFTFTLFLSPRSPLAFATTRVPPVFYGSVTGADRRAGSAAGNAFHLHVFVRPRIMIEDRNSSEASVVERTGERRRGEARFELFGALYEIPLVPTHSRESRSDPPHHRSQREAFAGERSINAVGKRHQLCGRW